MRRGRLAGALSRVPWRVAVLRLVVRVAQYAAGLLPFPISLAVEALLDLVELVADSAEPEQEREHPRGERPELPVRHP